MQVTATSEHITHAVIGAHESMDMGISSSAEFFHILSSTLYTDQIMAVVRETLCNAWDAHIDAGITDKHIEIALTDEVFAIRDFGKGIPKELILPIYGIYGASTKKNDGKATGGFGLGCKAPFAYVDHFEVTSCHGGFKTIYTMSKSSGRVDGKPAITPIVSVPSTDTGITVVIKLKPGDRHQFYTRLKRVLKNGEMKAIVNDIEFVTPYEFSKCEHGFLLSQEPFILGQSKNDDDHRIVVRYGNVIYPINSHDAYSHLLDQVEELLNKLSTVGRYSQTIARFYACLLAPSDSISVAPSREVLSLQERSVKTLTELLTNFIEKFKFGTTEVVWPRIEKCIEEEAKLGCYSRLMEHEPKSNWRSDDQLSNDRLIIEPKGITYQNSLLNYPENNPEIWNKELRKRIKLLEEANVIDRGLTQVWLRIQERPKLLATYNEYVNDYSRKTFNSHPRTWVDKHVTGPIAQGIHDDPELIMDNMYVYDTQFAHARRESYITTIKYAKYRKHFETLAYARKIVFLSRTKRDALEHVGKVLDDEGLGSKDCILFYNYQSKPKQFDAAVALFTKLGYRIFDLTEAQTPVPKFVPKIDNEVKVVQPRRKGYASLADVLLTERRPFRRCNQVGGTRIMDPEFFIKMTPTELDQDEYHYMFRDQSLMKMILPYIKDKGAIAVTSLQAMKLREQGVWDADEYVGHWVCDQMMTNQNIREYHSFNYERFLDDKGGVNYTQAIAMLHTLTMFPEIRKEFGFQDNRTTEEKKFCRMWESVRHWNRMLHSENVVISTIRNLHRIPINPQAGKLVSHVVNNHMLRQLDLPKLYILAKENTVQRKRIIKLLMLALKG